MVIFQDIESMYKNPLTFYTLTTRLQKKKFKNSFEITTKRIKYLGITLTKDLYSEDYNTLLTD